MIHPQTVNVLPVAKHIRLVRNVFVEPWLPREHHTGLGCNTTDLSQVVPSCLSVGHFPNDLRLVTLGLERTAVSSLAQLQYHTVHPQPRAEQDVPTARHHALHTTRKSVKCKATSQTPVQATHTHREHVHTQAGDVS
eukprot:scaffold921_cov397-Prasinococcus_capsulatus_cf.AAC.7